MTQKDSRSTEAEDRGERLQKALARAGVASRRGAERFIVEGRVSVDGEVVRELGTRVGPDAEIAVDGEPVGRIPGRRYILMNKPRGYLTSVSDPQGRPTVMEFVADEGPGLFPAGRLDLDTEGLLLMTDDGDLAYRLTHPSYHVPKTYTALVSGVPDEAALARLVSGIELEEGMTAPAEAGPVVPADRGALVTLTLREGKKRQVKRMLAAVGHPVRELTRVRFGPLEAEGLAPGETRPLRADEIEALREATGSR